MTEGTVKSDDPMMDGANAAARVLWQEAQKLAPVFAGKPNEEPAQAFILAATVLVNASGLRQYGIVPELIGALAAALCAGEPSANRRLWYEMMIGQFGVTITDIEASEVAGRTDPISRQ